MRAELYCVEAEWRVGGQRERTHLSQFGNRLAALVEARRLAARRPRRVRVYRVTGDPLATMWETREGARFDSVVDAADPLGGHQQHEVS